MKNIKLILAPVSGASEIFQAINIKFSFCHKVEEKKYKQLHMPIKCRDFLGDCIWSKVTGEKASIWRFTYNYKEAPYDDDAFRMSIKFPDKKTEQIFLKNFHHLNEKEVQADTSKSVLLATDSELCWLLEGDKAWQSNIWKVSLYTFYIKLLSYESVLKLNNPEDKYFAKLTPEKEKKMLEKITTEYKEKVWGDMNNAHNTSGFISILTGENKEMHKLILGDLNEM